MNGPDAANRIRGWPNIPLPTMGGKQLWADRFLYAGWRIQQCVLTGHARLLDPADVRRCWGGYGDCRATFEQIRSKRNLQPYGEHLVLLLHGLGRSRASFRGMEAALRVAGYDVAAITYPSTRRRLARNADDLAELLNNLQGISRVSFITHSLGGLLARELLSRKEADWRDRIDVSAIVMIAPPNQGSAMADILQYALPVNLALWRGLFDARTVHVHTLPAPDAPFGIIAAGRDGAGYNPFLAGDDDLIVRVAETELEGATDRLRVRGVHAFVMNDPAVIRGSIHFLEHRRFGNPA